ncbi:hypothetical protein V1478_015716 [Vespula squamosa]|uniref:Uncharacterized protein n=1 Tax=Vespula squamosa TaxID=30214 RepID=A0ABD2A2B2_VESSQ
MQEKLFEGSNLMERVQYNGVKLKRCQSMHKDYFNKIDIFFMEECLRILSRTKALEIVLCSRIYNFTPCVLSPSVTTFEPISSLNSAGSDSLRVSWLCDTVLLCLSM